MTKIQKIGFYATIIFSLNACTSVVWNGGIYDADRAINTQTVVRTTGQDHIYAFGHIPHQSKQPFSGSLVMMGGEFWYMIQPDVSEKIITPLTANLPKRYQITRPYGGDVLNALPVTITDGSHFSSDFCLDYRAENETEHQTLRQLGFQPQANPQHYRQCYATVGTIYAKPKQFAEDYRFQENIPVQLTLQQNQTNIQTGKLARNILLTPLALAVDALSGMVMVPILVIGDLF